MYGEKEAQRMRNHWPLGDDAPVRTAVDGGGRTTPGNDIEVLVRAVGARSGAAGRP